MRTPPKLWILCLLQAWMMMHLSSGLRSEDDILYALKSHPIKDLPKGVPVQKDELSLYADYLSKKDGRIHLYLINNTNDDLRNFSLGADRVVKDQKKDLWRRYEIYLNPTCDVISAPVILPAGHFTILTAYGDSPRGSPGPVKYAFSYRPGQTLYSNQGDIVIDPKQIERCRYDHQGMKEGPLKDVVAVALGEVPATQYFDYDAANDANDRTVAIRSLSRFKGNPEIIEVIKRVFQTIPANDPMSIHDPKWLNYIAEMEYAAALDSFYEVCESSDPEMPWNYINPEHMVFHSPYKEVIFDWLLNRYSDKHEKFVPVMLKVLDSPEHPSFYRAMANCIDVIGKADGVQKLRAIAKDKKYSLKTRRIAMDKWYKAMPNPFLIVKWKGLKHEGEEWEALSDIVITNISRVTVTLPGDDLEDVLVVKAKLVSGDEVPQKPRHVPSEKFLQIKPGESLKLKDIKWWEYLDFSGLKEGDLFQVELNVPTGDLWEVPASCLIYKDWKVK